MSWEAASESDGTPDQNNGLFCPLTMEYARKRYFVLFVLNIVLILYAVYGRAVPGIFNHPGLSWKRVVASMSLEDTTGIFSGLPQLALTLIGSFVLVLAVLRAFGVVDSILRGASRIAVRSRYALPQAAVVGSMGVAAVSGSGAANAVTTGSATRSPRPVLAHGRPVCRFDPSAHRGQRLADAASPTLSPHVGLDKSSRAVYTTRHAAPEPDSQHPSRARFPSAS